MKNFSELGLDTELIQALEIRGITAPTAVQSVVIPRLLAQENVFFSSETGTGKTLAYLLPAFRLLAESDGTLPRVLIIAPTHELASQIKTETQRLAKDSGRPVTAALFIGGAPLKRQIETLKEKPAIIIGGPARILELIRLKKLKTAGFQLVILDETDRMLAPETRDILRDLLATLPTEARFAACSATFSKYHASILETMLPHSDANNAQTARVHLPPEDVLRRNIEHWAIWSEGRDKIETLRKFIVAVHPQKALVFTAIAGQVENIAARLNYRGIPCSALYAKLDKTARKKNIDDFRSGRSSILVTSDISARGLDIPDVTHVIQLDVGDNEDFFIHRAGRTARAGKSGINVVMGDGFEMRKLAKIEKKLGIVMYPKAIYGGALKTPTVDEDAKESSEESE